MHVYRPLAHPRNINSQGYPPNPPLLRGGVTPDLFRSHRMLESLGESPVFYLYHISAVPPGSPVLFLHRRFRCPSLGGIVRSSAQKEASQQPVGAEDGGSCVLSIRPPAHLPINIPLFLFCCRFPTDLCKDEYSHHISCVISVYCSSAPLSVLSRTA